MRLIVSTIAIALALQCTAQSPLVIPPTLSGPNMDLYMLDTSKVFYAGTTTETYGINGNYLGPTLMLEKGETVTLNVHNQIADTTTMHWHGMHVAAENDGGPHSLILPGETWSPQFEVRDWASTFWYHPHLHGRTNEHVAKGAAGMIIVRDDTEAALELPRTYGTDEFPLVLQSKAFDANKQITIGNAFDSVLLVNGTRNPYLEVPAQVVRFHVLNGATERVFLLGFEDDRTFQQIGSDGGLLEAPADLTRLRLGPGERAELLVNLDGLQGQSLNLLNYGSEIPTGYYGATQPAAMGPGVISGYSSNALNGSDAQFLQLDVVAQTANPVTAIPTALVTHTIPDEADANQTRNLTFAPVVMGPQQMLVGPFDINNASFDMAVINQTIPFHNLEIWSLFNQSAIAHPFHIHDIQFYILDINGSAPPANMAGRKDVVLVPPMQTVRFITRFETFCDTVTPYMYHCHMLTHEDAGMMGQFVVQCPPLSTDNAPVTTLQVQAIPNPANGTQRIAWGVPASGTLQVFDAAGRQVYAAAVSNQTAHQLRIEAVEHGLYLLHWNLNGEAGTIKLMR